MPDGNFSLHAVGLSDGVRQEPMHRTLTQTEDKAQPPNEVSVRRAEYGRIVREQQSSLVRSARRMCPGDEDRALDLVQDAVIRGYEAFVRGGFQEGTNARAWLLRILTNVFISQYRRRQKWEGPSLDAAHDTALSGDGTAQARLESIPDADTGQPETVLMARTLDEPLERALAELPAEFRLCVLLVDVEGLQYAEAAAALGIPIGTVRSRLARARLLLHNTLFEYARLRRRV